MINYEKNLGTYSLRCYLWSDVCEKVWKYFDPTVFTTYRVKNGLWCKFGKVPNHFVPQIMHQNVAIIYGAVNFEL